MRYRVQVLENKSGLLYRTGPGTTYRTEGSYQTGQIFITSNSNISADGSIWFQNESTGYWCLYKDVKNTYLKILVDLTKVTRDVVREAQSKASIITSAANSTPYIGSSFENITQLLLNDTKQEIVHADGPLGPGGTLNDRSVRSAEVAYQNSNGYPNLVSFNNQNGSWKYDYTMDMSDINARLLLIKKNLNIPSLYNQSQLNRLNHTQFNRYKASYPDYERGPMIPYVVFTRPDLNIYDSSGKILEQYYANPQLHYLISANPMTAKSLTLAFSSNHDFLPLLSNRVGSLDVLDETTDTVETGETFTGYKSVYSKHSIKSNTVGTLSIKFPEAYNLALTTLHQIWVGYMSSVYRGNLTPKTKYITGKILDYACDIYYFLMDRDWTIRFWSKYYGCFPSTVNKSIFSYDSGSLVQYPELNITYNFIYKEDMSPDTISEFNANSKCIKGSSILYAKDYEPKLGHCGPTWTGPPFIEEVFIDEGHDTKSQRFVLRHRNSNPDSYIDSATTYSGDNSSSSTAITGIS